MSTTSSVTTNTNDYAPGSYAIVTATGFDAGSTVAFEVDHVSDPGADGIFGTADDTVIELGGEGHDAWFITDGGEGDLDGKVNGTIVTTWYVNPDDSAGARFLLTASTSSGWFASNTFTDAKPVTGQGEPANPNNPGGSLIETFLVSSTAGTGVIHSIVKIGSNTTFERGYNSDFRDVQFNETNAANFNRAITLAEIPVVDINGVSYREFDLDLNEDNGGTNPLITLHTLMIFASDTNLLTGFDPVTKTFPSGTATLLYNMDQAGDVSTLLTDWNSGSGTGDYAFFIPELGVSGLPGFTGLPQSKYIYIYSEFGTLNGQGSGVSGGFEEWFVVSAPNPSMTIDKTASIAGNVADHAGDVINYTLQVSNTGNVNLTGVIVTDPYADAGSIVRGADLFGDNDNILELAEVWTYTATHTVTQAEIDSNGGGDGSLENTATADSNETDPVTDSASVPVLQLPSLNITKDASVPGGSADAAGELISYVINVQNTGNMTLTGVTVTDPYADAGSITRAADVVGDNDNLLEVGETWSYTATHTVTQAEIDSNGGGDGFLENIATADSNQTDPDTDDASVPVDQNKALHIEKDADLTVVDTVGQTITYTYEVTNAGNAAIANVVVMDDNATPGDTTDDFELTLVDGDADNDGLLDVGETWMYESTRDVTQDMLDDGGDIVNTATATGDDAESDDDDATVTVDQNPGISIDKVTVYGSESGDDLTGIHIGDVIGWRYTVTNTGNVALSDVTVTDDNGTPLDDSDDFTANYISGDTDHDDLLDVNETWIFSASGFAVSGTYSNTGYVEGSSSDGQSATDSDDSGYTAIPREALIAPTNTTPYQYISGTAMSFQDYYVGQGGVIQYSVKGGKISQTNPGVFFYFTGASGDIDGVDNNNDGKADQMTVTIDQTMTPDGTTSAFKPLNVSNVQLYKVNDLNNNGMVDAGDSLTTIKLNSNQISMSSGDVSITFTPDAVDSMYIIGVKYQTSTVVGNTVVKSGGVYPTVNYTFDTVMDNVTIETYDGGVNLAPKPNTGSKMLLAGDGGDGAHAANDNQVNVLVKAAMAWWAAQGQDVSALADVSVDLSDLGQDGDGKWILGVTNGNDITLDDDGAGLGWSTGVGGVAANKVDMLSVLVHEMGHVLGMTDEQMGDMLAVGDRMVPGGETENGDDDAGGDDDAVASLPDQAEQWGMVGIQQAENHVNFS